VALVRSIGRLSVMHRLAPSLSLCALAQLASAVPTANKQFDCPGSGVSCYASQTAVTLMRKYQDRSDGLFGDTQPWIEANAIETMCDWAIQMGGPSSEAVAPLWPNITSMLILGANVTQPQSPSGHSTSCSTPYCGHFDDQGWWALAWAKAYELTSDPTYLIKSVALFFYLKDESWDESTCNGGAWWSEAHSYKNSITNQLFFVLATQLQSLISQPHTHQRLKKALLESRHNVLHDQMHSAIDPNMYMRWSMKSWRWLQEAGLRDNLTGLYRDGLNSSQCSRSDGNDLGANATWTYNQGVVLTGIGKLFEITGDETLLDTADDIVSSVMEYMTVPSVGNSHDRTHLMVEWSCNTCIGCKNLTPEGSCKSNWDSAMFKGAFMRHLGYFRRTPRLRFSRAEKYRRFAQQNADSAWRHARQTTTSRSRVGTPRDTTQLFGNDWRGPYRESEMATSQIAALSLFSSLLAE